jgi:hypothetical protein
LRKIWPYIDKRADAARELLDLLFISDYCINKIKNQKLNIKIADKPTVWELNTGYLLRSEKPKS